MSSDAGTDWFDILLGGILASVVSWLFSLWQQGKVTVLDHRLSIVDETRDIVAEAERASAQYFMCSDDSEMVALEISIRSLESDVRYNMSKILETLVNTYPDQHASLKTMYKYFIKELTADPFENRPFHPNSALSRRILLASSALRGELLSVKSLLVDTQPLLVWPRSASAIGSFFKAGWDYLKSFFK